MAEGLLRALYGDHYEVYSAGTHPSKVHPLAIKVMKEIGIDISSRTSKSSKKIASEDLDYVITVCDQAKETCPIFPGGKYLFHKSFKDPAKHIGSEEDILKIFRSVRQEIKDWIERFFKDPKAFHEKMNKGNNDA
jgi:arsenate reductase